MVFLLVRVHVSVSEWAGCFVNLWVRQGNPEEGREVGPGGAVGSREKGGSAEEGTEDRDEGLEKGGMQKGRKRGNSNCLLCWFFLNNLCNFKHLCINFLISHPGAGWPLTSQRPSVQWAGGEDQFLRVLSLFYDMIKCF